MSWIRIKLKGHEIVLLDEALDLLLPLPQGAVEEHFATVERFRERVIGLASEARELVRRVSPRLRLRECELEVAEKALQYARTSAEALAESMADQAERDAWMGRNAPRTKLQETSVAVQLLDLEARRLADSTVEILDSPEVKSVRRADAERHLQADAACSLKDPLARLETAAEV